VPRLLPMLGQVWADFRENNTESVQKQIPPTESLSPINLRHLPAQHPNGGSWTAGEARVELLPAPSLRFWQNRMEMMSPTLLVVLGCRRACAHARGVALPAGPEHVLTPAPTAVWSSW